LQAENQLTAKNEVKHTLNYGTNGWLFSMNIYGKNEQKLKE